MGVAIVGTNGKGQKVRVVIRTAHPIIHCTMFGGRCGHPSPVPVCQQSTQCNNGGNGCSWESWRQNR